MDNSSFGNKIGSTCCRGKPMKSKEKEPQSMKPTWRRNCKIIEIE